MPKTYVTGGDKLDTDPYNRVLEEPSLAAAPAQAGWWGRKSRKAKLLLIVIPIVLIALAIGLGVGLGLGLNKDNDSGGNSSEPNTSDTPIPSTPAAPTNSPNNNSTKTIWRPTAGEPWQIILENPLQLAANATSIEPASVNIWDIDLYTNSQEIIDTLHRLGKKVICYFSAGSYEPNRPDSNQFQKSDLGDELQGWPGEKWLNLTSPNVRAIMKARMELAAAKQCDGVDPDNVDAYANKNGIGMTQKDSIEFMGYLSGLAASLNMAIGLKNAGAIINQVLPGVQYAVNEQCVQYSECATWTPFIAANKPVFHIEYPSEVKAEVRAEFCKDTGQAAGAANFSTVTKHMNLDGWVLYCNGQTFTTPTNKTGS